MRIVSCLVSAVAALSISGAAHAQVSNPAYAGEAERVAGLIAGAWSVPGGACDTPVFETGARTQSVRGEDAMEGRLINAGVTIDGQAILSGPREGQFIDLQTDMVIFLFDVDMDMLPLSFLGPPTFGWPDLTLAPCRR